jgi:uncharacterized protein
VRDLSPAVSSLYLQSAQLFPDTTVALPLQLMGSARTETSPGGEKREPGTGREEEVTVAKEDRGFASMDRAKQREIASKGGKAAHQKGTAHEWTSEEARDAGRKGGLASHRRRREQMLGGGGTAADDMGDGESRPAGEQDREDDRNTDTTE